MMNLAVITSTRADYGLLSPLIKELKSDSFFNMELIVTGTHLYDKYGMTVKFIESEHFISEKIDIINETESDDEKAITIIIAEGIKKFADLYSRKKYDCIIVLGDRFELWSFCIPAVLMSIPIIHIHGGEKTEGAVDEIVRHSVSKMASVHFVSLESYRKRVIQMGETPEYVFTVGALGIDNILNTKIISKNDVMKFLDIYNDYVLVTYHPVTRDYYDDSAGQIEQVLEALLEISYTSVITMPNMDSGHNIIINTINKYCKKYPDKLKVFKSLGQANYINAMRYAKAMIGNSSSGILESASFQLPVINIGDRQKGRERPVNIIDCACGKDEIIKAFAYAMSDEFAIKLLECYNPYGNGSAAKKITQRLKEIDFSKKLFMKEFCDMDFKY